MARSVPAFAREFPDDPALAVLVDAFDAGDYQLVRSEAPRLAAKTQDSAVRAAANQLRTRTEADPLARAILLMTLTILVAMSAWWVAHDGPPENSARPAVPVERIPDSFERSR